MGLNLDHPQPFHQAVTQDMLLVGTEGSYYSGGGGFRHNMNRNSGVPARALSLIFSAFLLTRLPVMVSLTNASTALPREHAGQTDTVPPLNG